VLFVDIWVIDNHPFVKKRDNHGLVVSFWNVGVTGKQLPENQVFEYQLLTSVLA
jgi:hypothetical protein